MCWRFVVSAVHSSHWSKSSIIRLFWWPSWFVTVQKVRFVGRLGCLVCSIGSVSMWFAVRQQLVVVSLSAVYMVQLWLVQFGL